MSYSIVFSSIASWMISHRHSALICRISKTWYLYLLLSISLPMASISEQGLTLLYMTSYLRESTFSTLLPLPKHSPDPRQTDLSISRLVTPSMASLTLQPTSIATCSSTRIRPWTSPSSPSLVAQSSLSSSPTSLDSLSPLMCPPMIGSRSSTEMMCQHSISGSTLS